VVLGEVSSANVTMIVAFGGGVISILSPCVLPMVPGYIALVTGLEVRDVQAGRARDLGRIAAMTGWFALGFTAVFVLLGLAASTVGQNLFDNQTLLTRISGALVLVMALYLAGSQLLMAPRLYGESRFHVRSGQFGMFTAPVAGAAFAFGWSPCLGPIIAAVFGVAATETGPRAVLLLASYSAGMAVSFLAIGLAFGRWAAPLDFVKRHLRTLTLISAGVLAVFGVLLLLDRMWMLSSWLTRVLDALGLDRLVELG
jgi:cytochrome c-type biogenesis protein